MLGEKVLNRRGRGVTEFLSFGQSGCSVGNGDVLRCVQDDKVMFDEKVMNSKRRAFNRKERKEEPQRARRWTWQQEGREFGKARKRRFLLVRRARAPE